MLQMSTLSLISDKHCLLQGSQFLELPATELGCNTCALNYLQRAFGPRIDLQRLKTPSGLLRAPFVSSAPGTTDSETADSE